MTQRIAEVTDRLAYFDNVDTKKKDDKALPACEPSYLYYLDDKKIPQINGPDAEAYMMSFIGGAVVGAIGTAAGAFGPGGAIDPVTGFPMPGGFEGGPGTFPDPTTG